MIANDPKILGITDFFKWFYNWFLETSTVWFAYQDEKVIYKISSNSSLTPGKLMKKLPRS